MKPIAAAIARRGFLLLDGGLGTALEDAGANLNDPLWSARVLLDGEDLLKGVHRSYIDAGADCIATCTYQASEAGFATRGIGAHETRDLLQRAVDAALAAREEAARPDVLVAGSIGPYGAYLADGSEYSGWYGVSRQELYDFHASRWHALADSGVDVMAIETMPSAVEVEVLLGLLSETPELTAWVSFSCSDPGTLHDGTDLRETATRVGAHPGVEAVAVNCFRPELALAVIETLREATAAATATAPAPAPAMAPAPETGPATAPALAPANQTAVGVYPNAGDTYDPVSKTWAEVAGCVDPADAAPSWLAAGATLLGGCCRTTPDTIRRMRRALEG